VVLSDGIKSIALGTAHTGFARSSYRKVDAGATVHVGLGVHLSLEKGLLCCNMHRTSALTLNNTRRPTLHLTLSVRSTHRYLDPICTVCCCVKEHQVTAYSCTPCST